MEELLYNGIIYIRNRRGYWTRNNEIVHELLQRRLNAEWMNAFNIESFSVWRLRAEAVKCKENGDYVRAIQYLTRAMEIDNSRYYKRSYLSFRRVTVNFRCQENLLNYMNSFVISNICFPHRF